MNDLTIPCCPACGKPLNKRRKYCNRQCYAKALIGHPPTFTRTTPIEDRFWSQVSQGDVQECWEWQSCLNPNGYGRIGHGGRGGRKCAAHRVSWEIHYGAIPDSLWVLHKCDNPACVNPNHLFLGSHQDNMDDMIAKGRAAWQKNDRPR